MLPFSGESSLLITIPYSDNIEVEYKWLLVFDPENSQLPRPSENAKPLPAHLARKSRTTTEDPSNDCPKPDEPFCDPKGHHVWSEFHTAKIPPNPAQVQINLFKPKALWFYLGRTSTEAKAQYTGNLTVKTNDLAANFLESVKPVIPAVPPPQRRSYPASYPTGVNMHAANAARINAPIQQARLQLPQPPLKTQERPYNGKYAIKEPIPHEYKPRMGLHVDPQALRNQRVFQQTASVHPSLEYAANTPGYRVSSAQISPVAPMAPMMSAVQRRPSNPTNQGAGDNRRVSIVVTDHGSLFS